MFPDEGLAQRARFLIVTWDGGGNFPPALAIGRRVVESGHSVRILGPRSLEARVIDGGVGFSAFRNAPEWRSHWQTALDWQFLEELWLGPGVAVDLQSELAREPADVLLVDYILFAGLAAAELSGLPTAGLMHTLYHLNREGAWSRTWWRDYLPAINTTRRGMGLPTIRSASELWDGLALVLVLAPQAFDQPVSQMPANVHYVGPVLGPGAVESQWDLPWPPNDPLPLVLVSFSTTYQQQEAGIQRVIDALAELPVRALVTAGPAVDPKALTAPTNVVIRSYVDHQMVMPHAAVVVTHAGLSTVMAALARGVPLLCIPMGRDQDSNADRVVACGAGRTISLDAAVEEVRAAIVDVLDSPAYSEDARRLAEIIERYGNGSRAISRLERLLRTGPPELDGGGRAPRRGAARVRTRTRSAMKRMS